MTMTSAENVILDGGTLQKEVESLLRRYRPLGQPWLSAKLQLKFNEGRIELYSVLQRPTATRTSLPSESASQSGREIATNTPVPTDSTDQNIQNHEQCPQTPIASSPEANTNILQPEMEADNPPEIGNENDMAGDESMTCTTLPEEDVKSEPLEQDVEIHPSRAEKETDCVPVSLSNNRSDSNVRDEDGDFKYEPPDSSDMIDKDSEPMINLAISNVRSLSEAAVQSQEPNPRDEGTGELSNDPPDLQGDSSKKTARIDTDSSETESDGDDDDSNYEPDSTDETDSDTDSEDESKNNLTISKLRNLPERAFRSRKPKPLDLGTGDPSRKTKKRKRTRGDSSDSDSEDADCRFQF